MLSLLLAVGSIFGFMGPGTAGSAGPPPPSYDYITTQAAVHITTQAGVALKTDTP
jgi:hypothetical protein